MPEIKIALTSDTLEILSMRLILRALIDEIAAGLNLTSEAYRTEIKRRCADEIDCAEMDVIGDEDTEDVRTQMMTALASILE